MHAMRTPTLLVVALTICIATATIPALITLAPRAQPTASADPWQCITESLAQYLDVPKLTGSLFDELQSYAAELYEPCLAAITIEHRLVCFHHRCACGRPPSVLRLRQPGILMVGGAELYTILPYRGLPECVALYPAD